MTENRRASPRIWDPDWHVMRGLGEAVRGILDDPALQLSGARVLDFGCGTRPYEGWFVNAGAKYHGADLEGGHEVTLRPDGTLVAADAQYDLVASFQVLEHVWDVGRYLSEARRVLRKEGWLLVSTHGTWPYHPHPGDYRRWTAKGLRREVEEQGFSLMCICPVVGPLAWTTVFRNLGVSRLLRRIPVIGPLLAPLTATTLNLCAWLEDRVTPKSITADNACVYVALFRRGA